MTIPKKSSFQLMWMLGLAMTLPMILLSGPLAGYFFGYALVNRLHKPGFLMPLLIAIGFVASAWYTFSLIQKLMKIQKDLSQRNSENK